MVNLEKRLNCQLFNRTTRHLTLTQSGNDLLERCRLIVQETEQLLRNSYEEPAQPSGRLRVTMPQFVATLLVSEVFAAYIIEHPAVNLEMVVMTRVVNLVEEDFDLAIRVGDLPDSTLMARKLMELDLAAVASPAYLDRHGEPRNPADLRRHNCIVEIESPYKDQWPLHYGSTTRRYRVKGNVRVSNGETARDMAVGAAGIILLPYYMVQREIENGMLVPVLEHITPNYGGIFAVYPGTRYPSRTLRDFIEFLVQRCAAICASE